jgi:phosphoserine phosphatase RsbU/P
MRKFTIISVILYFFGILIGLYSPRSIFTILEGVGLVGLMVAGGYYGVIGFRWLKRKLLWKVRNKIIISYAVLGLIPILILGFMSWFALRLFLGQVAALYLDRELQTISENMRYISDRVLLGYYQDSRPVPGVEGIGHHVQEVFAELPPQLARASFAVFQKVGGGDDLDKGEIRRIVPGSFPGEQAATIPVWARQGFSGLVIAPGTAGLSNDTLGNTDLVLKSVSVFRQGRSTYWFCLDLPFDANLRDYIRQKTSIEVSHGAIEASDLFSGGRIHWAYFLNPVDWSTGAAAESRRLVYLTVPLREMYDYYLSGSGEGLLFVIAALGFLFIMVEGVAILVGFMIARSITRSIHSIYEGTQSIQEGNFDYRIKAGNRDQLDAMAAAFNSMAESISGLMNQMGEKERLDKEIEIAREVQAKLFPQKLPSIPNLQLAASCLAARQVSGDYYDFVQYGENCVDIIIADISGKGISAALLMASLQSSIRTLISYQYARTNGDVRIAQSVCEINRQLYHQTSPDKFATLVMSRFDAETLTLTYCNAGHNPPLVISNDKVFRLNRGGLVVGLFEDPVYEEETIQLASQDIVVFYTDGIVEAENPQGVQYDDDRLIELVKLNAFLTAEDLQALILDELSSWVAGGNQRDDMTVVIMKVD